MYRSCSWGKKKTYDCQITWRIQLGVRNGTWWIQPFLRQRSLDGLKNITAGQDGRKIRSEAGGKMEEVIGDQKSSWEL